MIVNRSVNRPAAVARSRSVSVSAAFTKVSTKGMSVLSEIASHTIGAMSRNGLHGCCSFIPSYNDFDPEALASAGGKLVVEAGGQKILLADVDGEVLAVSNKCSHLGLPLVGKTAMFQGKISDKCIVCPAHNTAFDLKTGEVKGEWCPTFPNLPLVGKVSPIILGIDLQSNLNPLDPPDW